MSQHFMDFFFTSITQADIYAVMQKLEISDSITNHADKSINLVI